MTGRPVTPSFRRSDFNPGDYRMSVGDHLEELRSRLIKAGLGVFVAFFGCLALTKQYLLPFITMPLVRALSELDLSPQLYQTGVADPFMVYLRISMIGAFVLSGPWVLYQVWAFVAAGLYPKERKTATRYLPFSMLLFASGVFFVWYIILPITLKFFLAWAGSIPLPAAYSDVPIVPAADVPVVTIPQVAGNVEPALPGQIWFDTVSQRFKVFVIGRDGVEGHVRVVPFGSENLVAPMITLPDYVSLVMMLLVVFGVSFQLPLVVMGLIRTGIVSPETLKQQRRIVYFVMIIAACAITPGDVITATLGLIGPMILLYEVGLWLGERGAPRKREDTEV